MPASFASQAVDSHRGAYLLRALKASFSRCPSVVPAAARSQQSWESKGAGDTTLIVPSELAPCQAGLQGRGKGVGAWARRNEMHKLTFSLFLVYMLVLGPRQAAPSNKQPDTHQFANRSCPLFLTEAHAASCPVVGFSQPWLLRRWWGTELGISSL